MFFDEISFKNNLYNIHILWDKSHLEHVQSQWQKVKLSNPIVAILQYFNILDSFKDLDPFEPHLRESHPIINQSYANYFIKVLSRYSDIQNWIYIRTNCEPFWNFQYHRKYWKTTEFWIHTKNFGFIGYSLDGVQFPCPERDFHFNMTWKYRHLSHK